MANRINGLGGDRPAAVGTGRTANGSGRTAGGAASDSSASSESIHITDAASQLAAVDLQTRALPVVNEAHVAALRGALAEGTYTVSSQKVADNLLSMERSLGLLG